MHKILIVSILMLSLSACNSNKTNTAISADTSSPVENKIMVPNSRCFSGIQGKDTVILKLENFPDVVTGNLKYNLFEKDKNNGTIDGKLNGDTLIADYRFISEGQTSVRQVAFLIKGSIATEGYADMEEKDGKMIFKNLNKLDFSKGMQLKETACTPE